MMHSFQVVLHRNIREIREIRGRYIHAKVVFPNYFFLSVSTMRAIWFGMRICCGHFERHTSQS